MNHRLVTSFPGARSRGLAGLLLLAALALLLAACGGNQTQQQQATQPPTLPLPPIGGLPPAASGLQPNGQLSLDTRLQLSIGLATNRQALSNDLAALYDPNSSQFGHYLTPQQLASRYGALQASIDQVTNYLKGQGFQVLSVSPLRDSISVSATVAQIAQAFQITLLTFQQQGTTVFGPSGTVTLPAALKPLVTSVVGLSSFAQVRPSNAFHSAALHAPDAPSAPDCSGAKSNGVTPNQTAMSYGYDAAHKAGYTGKGITIGVVEYDDNPSANDVNNFLTCTTGGKLHLSLVKVDGGVQQADNGATGETELDLEYLSAMAPDAQLIEYHTQCSDCGGATGAGVPFSEGFADMLTQIASEARVQVASISWGGEEASFSQDEIFKMDQSMQYLAAEGITFTAATGDCGAYAGGQFGTLSIQFPSSDPYALAVGGTMLQTTTQGNRTAEPVWSDPNPNKTRCDNSWGSTGGLSILFHQPTWQVGTGVKNKYSNGMRQVPDLAAMAWPEPEYQDAQWFPSGGTSAASPIWAAGIALIDQGLLQHHKQTVGATPTVYRVANQHSKLQPFFDVTQGNNQYYSATTGYDLATGWGAPNLMDFGKALGAF